MGFLGYKVERETAADSAVRIFLECQDDLKEPVPGEAPAKSAPAVVSYTYAVDVVFPGGKSPCRISGIEGVLALKKFYKVVSSLEERAREHGNPWQAPLDSFDGLIEHLGYTRNARNLSGDTVLIRRAPPDNLPASDFRSPAGSDGL